MNEPCIYVYRHRESGKVYVGQTKRPFNVRRREHLTSLSKTMYFENALRLHGEEAFEVFLFPVSQRWLNEVEKRFIVKYDSRHPNGYNLAPGGGNPSMSEMGKMRIAESNSQRVWTAESRLKNAEAQRNSPAQQEHLKKMAEGNRGRKATPEHRAKIAESNRRRSYSPETIAKMSASAKARHAREA